MIRSIKFIIIFLLMAACFTSAGEAAQYETEEERDAAFDSLPFYMTFDLAYAFCDTTYEFQRVQYYFENYFEAYPGFSGIRLVKYDLSPDPEHQPDYVEYYIKLEVYNTWTNSEFGIMEDGNVLFYDMFQGEWVLPTGHVANYGLAYEFYEDERTGFLDLRMIDRDNILSLTDNNNLDSGFFNSTECMVFGRNDQDIKYYNFAPVHDANNPDIISYPKTLFENEYEASFMQKFVYLTKRTYITFDNQEYLHSILFTSVNVSLQYEDGSFADYRLVPEDIDGTYLVDITDYTYNLESCYWSILYSDELPIGYANNEIFYDQSWNPDPEGYERYENLIEDVIPLIPPDDLNSDYSDLLNAYTPYLSSIAGNFTYIGCLYRGDDITKLLSKYNLKYCLTSTRFFDTYGSIVGSADVPNLQELNNVDFVVLVSWSDYTSLFDTEQKRTNMANNFLSWETIPETFQLDWISGYDMPLYVISKSTSYTSSAGSAPVECMIYFTESFRTKLNTLILLDGINVFRDYLVTNNAALGQTSQKVVDGLASIYLNIDTLGGKIDKTNMHLIDIKDLIANIKTDINNILDEMRSESERELPENGLFTPWLNFIKRIIGTYTPGAFINEFENYELPEDLIPEVTPAVEEDEENIPDAAYKIPIREGPNYA